MENYCLFCDKDNTEKHQIILENDTFYVRRDNFPVSKGHVEVVPKRHVESFFDLTDAEAIQLYALIKEAKGKLQAEYNPDGYNIGLNEGEDAGRTVHHAHVHIIPRYRGDVDNPRGGIRNIIPSKGDY